MASRAQRQKVVAEIDRERRALERAGVRRSERIGRALRRDVMARFLAGADEFSGNITAATTKLREVLGLGMLAAHLTGAVRTVIQVADRIFTGVPVPALPIATPGGPITNLYERAIEFSKRRLNLTDAQVIDIASRYDNEAGRAARGVFEAVDRRIKSAVVEVVREGMTRREGMKIIARAFEPIRTRTRGGVKIGPQLFETLYRTNVQVAYSAGGFEQDQAPEIQEVLWGYEYSTVGDDRVRASHALLDNTRLRKEDPRWKRIYPPNGWNCRCTVIRIFVEDDEATIKQPKPPKKDKDGKIIARPEPDKGFAFNPGEVFGGTPPPIV